MSAVVRPVPSGVPVLDNQSAVSDLTISTYSGPGKGFYLMEGSHLHVYLNTSLEPDELRNTRQALIDTARRHGTHTSTVARIAADTVA